MDQVVASHRNGGGAQLRVAKGGWTPGRRNDFLAMLAQTANVRMSVGSVGMSEQGVYKLRKRDPGFARRWGEALCEGYDKLETLMLQRALAGLESDAVPAGDGSKAAGLSERTILSLLNHHRQAVRELRESAALNAGRDAAADGADARARLEGKLARMHARLDGDDA